MKSTLLASTIMVSFGLSSVAFGQVTIDVSKITCEQYTLWKIADPDNIALWLAGYYNGKKDNLIIDPQAFKEHASKVKMYCILNPKILVMQAVETVMNTK